MKPETSNLQPENRLPGGQPGNTNALKHGFYARKFKPHHLDDYTRASLVTGLDEEIALLRLVILNLAGACLPAADGAPPDLPACHALEASLARLSHLLKDQRFLALGTTDPAGIIAALFADANAGLPFTRIFSTPAPLPSSLRRQTSQCEGDFQSPTPCDIPPSAEPLLPFDFPPSAEPPLSFDFSPSAAPPTPCDLPPSAAPPLPCDLPPSAAPPIVVDPKNWTHS